MADGESPRILDFLVSVAEDPEKQALLREDRERLIEESGLNERQKKILRSGDLERIRYAVEYEADVPETAAWIWINI